jgi:hypothetical protein
MSDPWFPDRWENRDRDFEIYQAVKDGSPYAPLCRKYNLSSATIGYIVKRVGSYLRRQEEGDERDEIGVDEWASRIPDHTLLYELDLSVRTANCLKNDNLLTVGDARTKTDEYLLRIPNFGRKSLRELREKIGPHDPWKVDKPTLKVVIEKLIDDELSRLTFDLRRILSSLEKIEKVSGVHGEQIAQIYTRLTLLGNHFDDTLKPTKWYQYRKRIKWRNRNWSGLKAMRDSEGCRVRRRMKINRWRRRLRSDGGQLDAG